MKDLDEQIQKLKKLLRSRRVEVKSVIPKKGFLKVTSQNGYIRYYTLDLNHSTLWERYESLTIENDVVKLACPDGAIFKFTLELEPLQA